MAETEKLSDMFEGACGRVGVLARAVPLLFCVCVCACLAAAVVVAVRARASAHTAAVVALSR